MPGNAIKEHLQGPWGMSLVFLISGVLAAVAINTGGAVLNLKEWVEFGGDWIPDNVSLDRFIDSFNRHSLYLDFSKPFDPDWELGGKIFIPGLFAAPFLMRSGGGK